MVLLKAVVCRTPSRPRYLPLRHARKLLARRLRDAPEELGPGQERLYSFYLPSLSAGSYTISSTQLVSVNTGGQLQLTGTQIFTVVTPRYSLPDGSVYTMYPPQGHADNVEILPHVVLNDPNLPWERVATTTPEDDKDRNRVPWLAVLVFTQEELSLIDTDIFSGTSLAQPVQQSTELSVTMSLADLSATNCITPVLNASGQPRDGDDPQTQADFIFVPSTLFNHLVTNYENPQGQTQCSLSRYKWLAHMRGINTTGMANSGIDDEVGNFSIVVSHRTGPLSITKPTQVIAHLVSIENIEQLQFPVAEGRVGLCSLGGWSYSCLPPDSLNIRDAFRNLGNTLDVLRPDDSLIKSVPTEWQRLADRLRDGYTMTQYRTQTGELTAALVRGPFAPTLVRHVWKPMSSFGTDLQVMDQEIGIMDLTYSVAWQLGKTLALADQSFTTSLGRIRLDLTRSGVKRVKEAALRVLNAFRGRTDTFKSLGNSVETLRTLPKERLKRGPAKRWRYEHHSAPTLDFAHNSDLIQSNFHEYTAPIATELAGSTTEGQVYNELNAPISPDWMIVLSWVLDRMYLSGIPAHYFIPDPSHLPSESLRFFHIDPNWIEALIDGALSVANHIDNDDQVRALIKEQINEYLAQPLGDLPYPPQLPTHGFLLRSELCVKFPDLIVEAPYSGTGAYEGATILRQENIDEGVLLVLFDRTPGSTDLDRLILRQPPHQQSFAAGAKLDAEALETAYKRVYTIPLASQPTGPERQQPLTTTTFQRDPNDSQLPFVWGNDTNDVHTLRLPQWINDVYNTIRTYLPNDFQEDLPTAALAGIQLNNPMYFLEVLLTKRDPLLSLVSDEDSKLRAFKMLESGSRRTRVQFSLSSLAEASVSSFLPQSDFSVPLPTPQDRLRIPKTRVNRRKLQPAPNFRRISTLPYHFPPETRAPAKPPQFRYVAYALGTSNLENPTVPMLTPPTPQDIIFGIRLVSNPGEYELREIHLLVRLGSIADENKNLAANYTGPGSVMLSNLRFNVIPTFGEQDGNQLLVLKLLPRSTEGNVRASLLNDLSFILSGIVVNNYGDEADAVQVQIDVVEVYEGFNIPLPADTLVVNLVKPT